MADDVIFQLKIEDIQPIEDNVIISVIKPSIRKHLANYDEIYYQKMKVLG